MAEIKAHLKYTRIAPRKVRLVANVIRGMDARRARLELKFLPKHSALPVAKLLESAIANAKHNFQVPEDGLYVKEIFVNQGNVLRRSMSRAFGRASPIHKRTSHISITLGTESPLVGKKKKQAPVVRDIQVEDLGEGFIDKKETKQKDTKVKVKNPNFTRKIFNRKAV